jgi:hypothetical protein
MKVVENIWLVIRLFIEKFTPEIDGVMVGLIVGMLFTYARINVHRDTTTYVYPNGTIQTTTRYDSSSVQINCSIRDSQTLNRNMRPDIFTEQ